MGDEITERAEQAAEQAGEVAEHEVSSAVEAVTETAETLVAIAEERAENAEAVSEAIVEAAMETERGVRIQQLEEGLSECRNELATCQAQLSAMAETQAQSLGILQGIQSSLTPPQSPPTPPEATETETAETIDPQAESPVENIPSEPEAFPPRKKRNWI